MITTKIIQLENPDNEKKPRLHSNDNITQILSFRFECNRLEHLWISFKNFLTKKMDLRKPVCHPRFILIHSNQHTHICENDFNLLNKLKVYWTRWYNALYRYISCFIKHSFQNLIKVSRPVYIASSNKRQRKHKCSMFNSMSRRLFLADLVNWISWSFSQKFIHWC